MLITKSLRITRSPSWMFSWVCCHFRCDCKVCKYSRRQRDQICSARSSVLARFQCKLILLLLLQGSGWQPIHLWLWYGAAANLPIWYDTTWYWSYLPQQKWPIAEFIIWIWILYWGNEAYQWSEYIFHTGESCQGSNSQSWSARPHVSDGARTLVGRGHIP